MVKLYFLGTDKRSTYLNELYEREEKENNNIQVVNILEEADVVITPIPFSKDRVHITGESIQVLDLINKCKDKLVIGGAMSAFKSEFEALNVKRVDLMVEDSLALLNAIPTAEGAIMKAMEYTDKVLHKSNVLVLGFGRVGKVLAHKLKGLDANVYCEARNKKDLAHINALGYNEVELKNMNSVLNKMDIIFSTVPNLMLKEDEIKLLNKECVIIDLASAPGSVDYMACKKHGINAYLELALPAKVAYKTAAEYLKKEIDKILECEFGGKL